MGNFRTVSRFEGADACELLAEFELRLLASLSMKFTRFLVEFMELFLRRLSMANLSLTAGFSGVWAKP